MRRIHPANIQTERELKAALFDLEKRWCSACLIDNPRKKAKELLKLRTEIKALLKVFSEIKRTANFNDNNDNLLGKMIKSVRRWAMALERKY